MQPNARTRLYASLVRRGFDSLVLLSATDEDIPELTRGFPLAQRYVHSLSLRCCAVTDRGLEALLDHLQVNFLPLNYFSLDTHDTQVKSTYGLPLFLGFVRA